MSGTDKFFGGVIGYVIGGDNIIDNVAVNVEGSGLKIANDNAKLLPVGGYVGLVGGADCEKGGGVVFRNMASHPGLTSVNTEKGSVAVNTEAADGNVYYYWNPYIGRVLDGFACSEGTALTNTDVYKRQNWSGNYIEAEKNAVETFNTLGMINYKISGQVEEDCVLSWDPSRVEIDDWFLKSMNINSSQVQDNGGRKSVTLHLGSPNTPQQYTITFYRTYARQDLNESWQEISQYITFKNSKQ